MGTYNIPRNTKGEGRLFYVFSKKALIYTVAGILIGVILKVILKAIGGLFHAAGLFNGIGIALIIILAILGFVIGTAKLPQNDKFEITKKAAGIQLDKVIWESFKFKFIKKEKLYVYDTDELTREEIQSEIDEETELKEKEEKLKAEEIEKISRNRRGYIR